MVNPHITYKDKSSCRRAGIGICLKELLSSLDKYSVQHESESIIRAKLRRSDQCVTRSKQYFLNSTSKMSYISRKNQTDVKCKACICIPCECVQHIFGSV